MKLNDITDYSLEAMQAQFMAANGGKRLTDEELAFVAKHHKNIATAKKELQDAERKAEQAGKEAEPSQYLKLVAEEARIESGGDRRRPTFGARWDCRVELARERIAFRNGQYLSVRFEPSVKRVFASIYTLKFALLIYAFFLTISTLLFFRGQVEEISINSMRVFLAILLGFFLTLSTGMVLDILKLKIAWTTVPDCWGNVKRLHPWLVHVYQIFSIAIFFVTIRYATHLATNEKFLNVHIALSLFLFCLLGIAFVAIATGLIEEALVWWTRRSTRNDIQNN